MIRKSIDQIRIQSQVLPVDLLDHEIRLVIVPIYDPGDNPAQEPRKLFNQKDYEVFLVHAETFFGPRSESSEYGLVLTAKPNVHHYGGMSQEKRKNERQHFIDPAFEQAFAREMLASEVRRVTILAALLAGILGFIYLAAFVFFRDAVARLNAPPGSVLIGTAAFCAAILYELVIRYVFLGFLKRGTQPPAPARYINAFVETSIPTVMIVLFAVLLGTPAEALFSPPSYVYFLFIMLATLRLDFRLCVFTGLVAAVEYLGLFLYFRVEIQAYTQSPLLSVAPFHIAKSALYFAGGLVAGFVSNDIKKRFLKSLGSMAERNRIVDMFGKHVSPQVVDKLLDQKQEMESETRHVCVMFLDIRDFTTFSEKKPPEDIVDYLNRLFDFMIEIITRNNGIINKFLGDGFMAVFGAPFSDGRDSANALAAAREILIELEKKNGSGEIPQTRIGIGLHSGAAVTGNVGSARRKEYTIIGDTVNVAARIEQLNKVFGSQLLISENVREDLAGKGADDNLADARAMEPMQVKGRNEPVQVYRIL